MRISNIDRPWLPKRTYQGPKQKDSYYQSSAWRTLRNAFINANPYCAKCGDKATVADHIVRRKDGGTDTFNNLMALCYSCHQSKSAGEANRNRK